MAAGSARAPSIKGTAFQSVPDDLNRLLDSGRLARERLEARLRAEDLEILADKILPSVWYPIASYARMVELLAEVEGGTDRQRYCVERGRRAAERLAQAGIYPQLDASTESLGSRVGRFVITLAQALYSFTSWSFTAEPEARGGFTIHVDEAADFPEVSRFATQGFIEVAATRVAGMPMRLESERHGRDRIVYRAERSG